MRVNEELPGPDPHRVGANIRTLRGSRWTMEQLAVDTGRSFSSINQYELGMKVPPLPVLMRLSELFDVSIDELIGNHVPRRRTAA